MIHAKIYYLPKEGSFHLVLEGHACTAPKGQDLVCAGASTLACTLGEAVEKFYEAGMLERYPRVYTGPGYAEIIALPKELYRQPVMIAFWTAELGIGLLAGEYPEHVKLEEVLVTPNL